MNNNLNCQGYLDAWQAWVTHSAAILAPTADTLAELLYLVIAAGGRLLLCGNGGSAADAQHFAAELVGRFAYEREAMPALALACQPSAVTALANDYGFESVFARQAEAFGRPGDCLIGITTSGRSPNILAALRAAKGGGLLTVALTGVDGIDPAAAGWVDVSVSVPKPPGHGDGLTTPHVQEVHIALLHAVAAGIERAALRHRPKERQTGHSHLPAAGWSTPPRSAVFLDRDGTLIVKHPRVVSPTQVQLLPGAAAAVRRLNECGVPAILVTNQAAVGRGELAEAALMLIHDKLGELLGAEGARLDGVYFCPHVPATCGCRKPLPGMLLAAAADLHLHPASSWMVGDTWADVKAGLASGGRGVLVRTGLGAEQAGQGDPLASEVRDRYSIVETVQDAIDLALASIIRTVGESGSG